MVGYWPGIIKLNWAGTLGHLPLDYMFEYDTLHMVDVLIVGSGGREHALCWRLAKSNKVDTIYTAPGNGGTPNNVPIRVNDLDGLAAFARKHDCFTVVGPEAPLADGIVDRFNREGLQIFGPTRDATRLESSKTWAKEFMTRNKIPTAQFGTFTDTEKALEYSRSLDGNIVVKADGLAAGKGVIVCNNMDEATAAIDTILTKKTFGYAGHSIVVEERLDGTEASYIALCDGKMAVPMASSQDHKRIYDGDRGPNTGGMGAYSPTPTINDALADKIQEEIINKTVSIMNIEGTPFSGFLYAGVMISDGQPYVLEYNVRMGDPECQPIVARMNFDLFEYIEASVDGRLSELPAPSWTKQAAVCVVLASEGYPESYPKDEKIIGLDSIAGDSIVFHAGTKSDDGRILSNGGRVLGVTALGDTLESAISHAYDSAERISWPHKYYRRDIGQKGLGI